MTAHQSRRVVRRSRALGIPLTPKAVRFWERRPYPPGEHGRARRPAKTDYSNQPAREAAAACAVRHPRVAAFARCSARPCATPAAPATCWSSLLEPASRRDRPARRHRPHHRPGPSDRGAPPHRGRRQAWSTSRPTACAPARS
nr:hypothetical protein [Angustibacter aerolatus]